VTQIPVGAYREGKTLGCCKGEEQSAYNEMYERVVWKISLGCQTSCALPELLYLLLKLPIQNQVSRNLHKDSKAKKESDDRSLFENVTGSLSIKL
jgi:hypothetical protein